jgi:exonuclease SbcD
MKFIHAADIHLDSPLVGLAAYDGAPVDLLRGATRRAFQAMVDLAEAEAVDFVLIAGDVYDGDWRDFNTGLFFVQQMARLRQCNIPVYVIHGNHDAESQITRKLPLPENVTVFSSRKAEKHEIPNLKVTIHGQSFKQREVLDNLAAGYKPPVPGHFNIGLLHTSADGREGHAGYAPCEPADLARHGYDYWALGHVHNREVLHEHPYIVFPGNLQGRNIRETGSKGCTLVTVDDGHITRIEHRPVDVLRWAMVEIDLSGCESTGDALARVRAGLEQAVADAEGRPLAARLRLTGATPLHGKLLARHDSFQAEVRAVALDLAVDAVWIEKIVTVTRPVRDLIALSLRQDAVGSLLRSLDSLATEPELHATLQSELEELMAKLPRELDADDPGSGLTVLRDPAALIGEAKAIVLSRLLDQEFDR